MDRRLLFRQDGTLSRGPYAVLGVLLVLVKVLADRLLAAAFRVTWTVWDYWHAPDPIGLALYGEPRGRAFLLAMAALALPFMWVGLTLTLRRMRDAGWPLRTALFFLVPFGNVVLFAVLSVLPHREITPPQPEVQGPSRPEMSALAVIGITVAVGAALTAFGVLWINLYGWGLFVALPFAMGFAATWLHTARRKRTMRECQMVSQISVLALGSLLLLLGWEGLICLLMATPVVGGLTALGAAFVLGLRREAWQQTLKQGSYGALALVWLAVPGIMGVERAAPPVPRIDAVTTTVDVDAAPAVVWRAVLAFPPLAPPRAWYFRHGIAYPIGAEITGTGVGAVRHCTFSTGNFIEPITDWDAPNRLAFTVAAQPMAMTEWMPFRSHASVPPHLSRSYFRTVRGEFRLVPLAGGRTRLEGTTWYQNQLWPAAYWRVWTDAILHRIHQRVLQHVKKIAEQSAAR